MSVTSSSGNRYFAHRLPGVMNFLARASGPSGAYMLDIAAMVIFKLIGQCHNIYMRSSKVAVVFYKISN